MDYLPNNKKIDARKNELVGIAWPEEGEENGIFDQRENKEMIVTERTTEDNTKEKKERKKWRQAGRCYRKKDSQKVEKSKGKRKITSRPKYHPIGLEQRYNDDI